MPQFPQSQTVLCMLFLWILKPVTLMAKMSEMAEMAEMKSSLQIDSVKNGTNQILHKHYAISISNKLEDNKFNGCSDTKRDGMDEEGAMLDRLLCDVDKVDKVDYERNNSYYIEDDGMGMRRWGELFEPSSKGGMLAWLLAAILIVFILAGLITFFLYSKATADGKNAENSHYPYGRRPRRGTMRILPKESLTMQ